MRAVGEEERAWLSVSPNPRHQREPVTAILRGRTRTGYEPFDSTGVPAICDLSGWRALLHEIGTRITEGARCLEDGVLLRRSRKNSERRARPTHEQTMDRSRAHSAALCGGVAGRPIQTDRDCRNPRQTGEFVSRPAIDGGGAGLLCMRGEHAASGARPAHPDGRVAASLL
jgi:hypothetical protein